jgi:histone deacetylase HOS3
MALRTRKPTKPIAETVEEEEDKKPAPKTSRRKTVAGAAVLAEKVCLGCFNCLAGKEHMSYFVSIDGREANRYMQAPSRSSTPLPEASYAKPTSQSNRRLSLASNAESVMSESSSSRATSRVCIPQKI